MHVLYLEERYKYIQGARERQCLIVTIREYHTAYSIFTLYSHKVSILVANVYFNNLDE